MSRELRSVVIKLLLLSVAVTAGLIWWTSAHAAHTASLRHIQAESDVRTSPHKAPALEQHHTGSTRTPKFSFVRQFWWFAPIFSGGGYSSEAVDFLLGLQVHAQQALRGVRLYAMQHGDLHDDSVLQGMRQNDSQALLSLMSVQGRWFNRAISICHSEPGAWALPDPLYETSICPPPNSWYKIGRTMFETDRLSEEHARRCNAMDEIWVPTEFHRDVFARSGVDLSRLVVVPEPVDTDYFAPGRIPPLPLPMGRPIFGQPHSRDKQPFVFLSIFKWEKRKAWEVLLEAFLAEFTADDPAELYMLTHPFHGTEDFEDQAQKWATDKGLIAGTSGWPTVQVITDHIPQQHLPGLYEAADAFVLPSRGEGWGRPHVEAMSMGLPVIATNWSGPTAFLDETCGYPLRYNGLVKIRSAGAFEGHEWADPSVTHLRELMRRAVSHPHEAQAKGRVARQRMQARYALPIIAEEVVAHLRRIDDKLHSQLQTKQAQQGTNRAT